MNSIIVQQKNAYILKSIASKEEMGGKSECVGIDLRTLAIANVHPFKLFRQYYAEVYNIDCYTAPRLPTRSV